tara:strand:+ start:2743 stop:3591 length:849 start_codon:yes stop_codon:yes gene_type:complete
MLVKLIQKSWRKLFPILQKKIPIFYGNPLLAKLNKAAIVFHLLYENNNYDPEHNGEKWLLEKLNNFTPKVIFDVGANKGTYSEIILSSCPESLIYAFEPIPEVFSSLKSSLGQNPQVQIFQSALSEKEEKILLFYDENNDGNTSAVKGVQDSIHGLTSYKEVKSDSTSLDIFCSSKNISSIDLLKIDVEGFESKVLKGAKILLQEKRIKMVQIEYGKANLFSRYFLYDYFNDYSEDYVIGKLYPKGVIWFNQYKTELDDLLGPNLIMVLKNEITLIEMLSKN